MLSKKAQVNRVREFFGDTAANIVKAILNGQLCGVDDEVKVNIETLSEQGSLIIVIKDFPDPTFTNVKRITVWCGAAKGVFVDGKDPKYTTEGVK